MPADVITLIQSHRSTPAKYTIQRSTKSMQNTHSPRVPQWAAFRKCKWAEQNRTILENGFGQVLCPLSCRLTLDFAKPLLAIIHVVRQFVCRYLIRRAWLPDFVVFAQIQSEISKAIGKKVDNAEVCEKFVEMFDEWMWMEIMQGISIGLYENKAQILSFMATTGLVWWVWWVWWVWYLILRKFRNIQ